jgi:hypothetical protein
MGTELKMKPVGDKSIKLQKINKQVSKKLNKKEVGVSDIMPGGITKVLRMIYLMLLIPVVLIVGLVDGVCYGFLKFLDTGLGMYKKALGDRSWFK